MRLPFFPGFYESMLSSAIDSHEEQEAEYMAEKENSQQYEPETYQPEHLRISAQEYASLFFDCCRYSPVYHKIAQFWVEAFDLWCKNNLGTPEGSFTFEQMVSPREYNFTTDVVYAYVPEAVIQSLFEKSAKDGRVAFTHIGFSEYHGKRHVYAGCFETQASGPVEEVVAYLETLKGQIPTEEESLLWQGSNGWWYSGGEARSLIAGEIAALLDGTHSSLNMDEGINGHKTLESVIKANFTSYDGFSSFYPNDLETWLEKPLSEWDYNELGTLLGAVMQLCEYFEDNDQFRWQLYESIFSGNGEEDEAWSAGMDWPKFEEKVKELRAEKLEEHNAVTKEGK